MALVTLAEYKASIYQDDTRSFTDDQLTQALAIAEDVFYSRTNRHELGYWIEARELTVSLHSTGLPALRCPYPVLGLISVTDAGVDITSSVNSKGHFIFKNGSRFGTVPTSIDQTVYATIEVTAKFGDPARKIIRDSSLVPTVPWDVKDCIMRLAWHQAKRERVTIHHASSRDAKAGKEVKADMSRDPQIVSVLRDWAVIENSGFFDWR